MDIAHITEEIAGLIPAYAEYYLQRDLDKYKVLATETKFKPVPIPGTDWRHAGIRLGRVFLLSRANPPVFTPLFSFSCLTVDVEFYDFEEGLGKCAELWAS